MKIAELVGQMALLVCRGDEAELSSSFRYMLMKLIELVIKLHKQNLVQQL